MRNITIFLSVLILLISCSKKKTISKIGYKVIQYKKTLSFDFTDERAHVSGFVDFVIGETLHELKIKDSLRLEVKLPGQNIVINYPYTKKQIHKNRELHESKDSAYIKTTRFILDSLSAAELETISLFVKSNYE